MQGADSSLSRDCSRGMALIRPFDAIAQYSYTTVNRYVDCAIRIHTSELIITFVDAAMICAPIRHSHPSSCCQVHCACVELMHAF